MGLFTGNDLFCTLAVGSINSGIMFEGAYRFALSDQAGTVRLLVPTFDIATSATRLEVLTRAAQITPEAQAALRNISIVSGSDLLRGQIPSATNASAIFE